MLTLKIDGVELGVAVGLLAVLWVFVSLFIYLLWFRFLKEKMVRITEPMYKAVMIIAFSLLIALMLFALFFSQTQSSFEVNYIFPLDLTYKYLSSTV
ncbi:MAG: hypothetical protein GF416_07665 [Candidatus Altiarchaeales archaeon]|nr:hypothetical protein [Candidatus Altiarchaeales archaeon]MBD3416989.1 hypothetical protein [Candidatus Altiarchaeales archaeon]